MDVGIRVGLLAGPFQAVSLAVRLGAAAVDVLLMIPSHVIDGSLVVVGSFRLVDFLGADGQGADGVVTHATVYAAPHPAGGQADQFLFLQKIIRILGKMRPPVDLLAGDGRCGRRDAFPPRIQGDLERGVHHVDPRYQPMIVAADLLAADIDVGFHLEQTFTILLFRSQHGFSPFSDPFGCPLYSQALW